MAYHLHSVVWQNTHLYAALCSNLWRCDSSQKATFYHRRYELIGNGSSGRQPQVSFLVAFAGIFAKTTCANPQGFLHLFQLKPFSSFQFGVIVELDRFILSTCDLSYCADHQICWIRPWLGGMYDNSGQDDTSLLPYLATHSVFYRLGRFHKTC